MSSIDERYEEWKKKKNARSEGESTDSSSQTASVDDRYKAWRAQRLDLEGIANSIADRTSTWLKNHNNYLSNYNNRFSGRKGTYEDSYVADSGDWLSTVSQQRDNFEKEANSILSMLDKYGDYLDPKWTSSIRDALTSAGTQQADILKYATGDSDYWSQFASEDEYGLWQKDQGYRSKYSGQSYEDIMASIGQLEDGEEKQWLSSNKYDLLGTAADFGDRSASGWEKYLTDDEARKQREQGQDKSETFWEKLGRWLGTTPDTSLPMGTTSQVINDLRNDTSYQRPSSNWTEEQKSMYGYLYDADKNAAAQYAQMTNEANAQAENQEKIAAIENWATKNGWTGAASTIGAIAMMPLSLADTLSALTEYNARGFVSTPSTPLPGQVSQAITGAIATTLNENGGTLNEKIPVIGGKGWGDAYQLGTSIAQSMISGYTQGGLGTYMVFFGSASSSAMYDAKNRGASDEQAITLGILSGLAEAAGEAFSVEHLLSNGSVSELSGFFSNVLLQAGIEASEEGVTTLLNNFSDQLVMGDKSNFNILVQQYMSEGMSEEDAKKKAWKSMANDLLFDMLGGAISGGVSSGLQTGVQTMFANHDAKQTYGNYAGELVGEALEIDPSNTFAQKMQGRLDSGKKLSGGQLNRLVQQNERTLTAQDLSSIQSAATQRLTELGETGDVDAIAGALTKRFSGQKLTHKESQLIQNSQYGRRVSTEMNPENIRNGGYSSEWAENIGTERINAQEYSRMLEAAQQDQETAEATGGQVVTETQNEVQAAKTEPSNVVFAENATTAKSVSKDGVTRQVSTGKEVTPKKIVSISGSKVMIETDSGTVSADDIEFDTMENDLLWRSAVQFNGITASGANGIVRAYRNGESVTSYLAGAGQEFRNGYYNLPSGGEMANKLTSAQREIIYELGQKAAGENIAKAQAKAKADKKSSATVSKTEKVGKVHFERNGRTFDGVRETALKTMEQLSAALGVEFYVFESYKNEAGKLVYKDANGNEVPAPNGYYDPKDGSIHIDLNAGVDGKGTMLFTVAHELTHFINQWSPAKFKVLANVLMKQYAEKNVSVDDLVNNQIKKAEKNGREITWDEAYEEVVADSMEAMLTDGNVVQLMADLKQQDKTLWQKICDWFKDLVADLKAVVDAYKGYKPDSSEGRMVAQMQDVIVMLESFYADALLDAGENYQAAAEAQKNTTQEGDVKMSIRDDFYSEVDSWDGKSKRTFVVGRTSDVLKNIGAKDSRIIWHGEKMARIMREHSGMDKTVIKQVPQILENPVIILASKQSDSRLVIFGTVTDTNGTPVTAILELQPTNKGGQILDMQVIASAYGKDNTKNLVESSGLVYIDPNKQRTKIWMQGVGLQLPSDATNLGSVGSITYPDGKVKIESVPYSQYMQGGGNKFSVREIVPISNDDIKRAEQFFGTTTNYSVAGYLLTDGRMLDFSGKHWGDTSSTSRQVDHRDIWDAWENGDRDGFAEMVNMIGNGNIRLMPESGGINLASMPNATQITTLRGYINHFRGEVIVDVDKVGGDTIHSFEYSRGTSSSKILSDIKEYFENGTVPKKQSGIRDFLYSDRDSDGNQLSTEQQEYFKDSQVRDEQGRLLAMYHGTPNGGFTKFRSGTYFTQNAAYADVYQSLGASSISTKKGADAPMTYKVYLDIKKPFDTRNAKERKIFEQEFYRKYGTGTPLADSGLPDWVDGMDLQEFIEEMEYDYDGLILDEGGVGGYGDEVVSRGLSYVVFSPEQVKDVDNKKPTDDPDIRYSDRDSEGNDLTKEQKEFFADSKVRDSEGNLLVVYHGTPNGNTTVFDKVKTSKINDMGQGIYFSTNKGDASSYMGKSRNKKLYSTYVNIKAPFVVSDNVKITVSEAASLLKLCDDRTLASDVYRGDVLINAKDGYITTAQLANTNISQYMTEMLEKSGKYDGIIDETVSAKFGLEEGTKHIIALNSNQIKLVNNMNPTADSDIRYSERDPELEKVNRVLEKENAQLKHDVAYLKELLKLQNQVTGGTKFTKTSVEAAAGQLMKHADAKGDRKELAGLLNGLYEYIAGSKEPTWDGVVEAAQPAVEWLKSHVRTRTERSAYAKDVLKEIQNSRIYLDEQQKKEVAYQYGSYNEFRKKTMGSVILTDTATMSLDSQWHEWAAKYPNLFDPDITSTNMPSALMDVFDSLRNMTATDSYGYDQELLGQELLSRVYDSYWNVSTLYTVKDKAQKEINKLKFEHVGRMATLREYHKEQTTKLKTEHREALQKVKQAERERSEKKLQEISERYQESRQKGIENRRKTEMRRKIRRTIMDLNKILNRGDKKRNVKEDMKDLVSKALKTADILFTDNYMAEDMVRNGVGTEMTEQEAKYLTEAQSILAEIESAGTLQDRQEAENRLQGKLDYRMSKLKDVFAREKARLNKTKVSEVLGDLADAYASLEDSEYSYVSGAFDENVHQYLTMLKADVGGTIVKDMSLNQLDELHKAYTMVLTTVRNANKMFAANLKQTREQLGSQVIGEVKQAGGEHGLWLPGEDKLNAFSWNNQKPVYAFERIGSATLTKLFENTRAGEDSWAQDMTEAREYYLAQTKKHHYDSWNFDKQFKFTSTSGIDFSLNLEQIMSLYAYSKREQAHDHLLKGGFVFDGNTEVQVNKMGIKVTYLNKTAKAHNISPEIMGQIISKLTAEQKAFVDEMQDYLSTTMGEKGNEVSMQLYGVKLFNEKHYFPLRSAGQYMARAKEADLKKQQGQISIVNSGFTKSTTPKSSNPVVLSGFMDVWADHVNEMSMYHSFVLPMEDFRRVYNYSSPNMETGQSVSVNSVIQEAYGEAATGYIDQLYRDLNGGAVSDPRENGIKALVGKFKKAAVFASLSVVIQQPSAIGRAFAIIDPKYFIGSKVDNKRHKALWAELKKYAPVAVIKEMGYFDTGMGKSAQDFIKGKEYNTLKEKAAALFTDKDYRDEVLSKAPALADELTWCAIWEAAKRETKANNPKMDVKSEEFLQLAGKRFTEVITKTQVYDSVLSRSANMRSKGVFMSMWTAFMAEPTTSINMLEDALRKAKRGNKKYAAKAIGAVTTSVVLNSLLSSLVYAMRDDDDDETFLEKYVQSFATEILDGINPLTYYPFLKDIWSSLQGFDIERSDMSLITSLVEKVTKLVQVYAKDAEDRNDGDLANAWWGVADYVAAIAGVPVKNVRRDINGAINTYKTVSQDLTDRDTTWGSLVDKTWDSVKNSLPVVGWLPDETAADKLYKATVSGDTVYQKRLSSAYDTQEKLDNAIRKGLRANDSRIWEAAMAWNNNDLASYMRIAKEIIGEGHFSQDNVVMAIQAEAKAMLPNDSDSTEKAKGYFTADKFAVAISQGNDTMAATIKADIIETAQKNGKTAEEAEDSFTSSAKSSIKKLFQKGGMTGTQAAKALVDYFGISEEDAAEDVQYWTFQNKYPEYDMSESAVTRYYEYAEPAGIDVSVYYDYYTQASKCESDLDKNGNAISGSKKAKILDVIDSMELTKAQKDALYYANGWAKSTIYEAPWR